MLLDQNGDHFSNVNMQGWIVHPSQVLTTACDDGTNKAYVETHVINLVEDNATNDGSELWSKFRIMWAGVEY